MLELTRLNGNRFFVNGDLIQYAEAAPDTVLTLVTGEKLVVRESCSQVIAAGIEYRAEVLRQAWPDAASALTARAAHEAQSQLLPRRRGSGQQASTQQVSVPHGLGQRGSAPHGAQDNEQP